MYGVEKVSVNFSFYLFCRHSVVLPLVCMVTTMKQLPTWLWRQSGHGWRRIQKK